MKGAIKSSFDGKYRINKSNYNSGISKEEYASFSDSAVLGSYMRAVNTAKGGYLAKETNQGLSSVRLSAKGSNCGTTKTEQVLLTKSNKKDYINRFIVDHGNIIELTDDNWSKYENKVVNMRSPLYCIEKQPCYCNICVGNSPYKMNMENIGSAFNTIPNAIMYVSMKAFHDTTIKTSEIDINDIFLD